MGKHKVPNLAKELSRRIRIVRRDMGDLLFHFTRAPKSQCVEVECGQGKLVMPATAASVLRKIVHDGSLHGTSGWTYGETCVCFTEAPIIEFNSIFSLVEIASSKKERPRYEPYGIAVSKKWLFRHGGRPVIYDHPDSLGVFPDSLRYRFVPYDPETGIDYTWEREWRIKSESLKLDPSQTLVVLPTSHEAFEFVYEFAEVDADWDVEGSSGDGYISGFYHEPKWFAVSLDLFGFSHRADVDAR